MKKVAIALVLVLFSLVTVFAQGAIEEAANEGYDEGYQVGWDEAKSDIPYSMNPGVMNGHTRPAVSGQAVVHAGSPEAAAAGYAVLVNGGNAFDAAMATAAAQTFSETMMTSIFGGDAEIIIYDAKTKEVKVYNGTGWAPKNATIDFYLEMAGFPAYGIYSMEIPGEWSGWMTLLNDYGSMELSDIFAPVISLAENGMICNEFLHGTLSWLASTGNDAAKAVFNPDMKLGDKVVNKDYANLLRTMGEVANGKNYKAAEDYFYRGPIAEQIVKWNNDLGGLFSIEDFNEYHAEIQTPITTNYRGYDVYCCPANCQGPTLIEALNILENFDLASMEHNSAEYINIVVQALNIAINDRNKYLGDPRFTDIPTAPWTKEYAAEMAKLIDTEKAMSEIPSFDADKFEDYNTKGPDTTFMAVVDAEGNMCIVTHSINYYYGSGLMVDGLGFFMNDRIQNFSLDEEHQNCLAAHKRPMQTITPSIGLKDGEPAFFVGTPNANNQEQTKLQVLLNYIEFGYRPQEAVEHPRFTTGHAPAFGKDGYNPGALTLMNAFGTRQNAKLEEMGYKISYTANTGSLGFGIYENGMWTVGADPTRNAYSVGL